MQARIKPEEFENDFDEFGKDEDDFPDLPTIDKDQMEEFEGIAISR
jgi:hypothetical protein